MRTRLLKRFLKVETVAQQGSGSSQTHTTGEDACYTNHNQAAQPIEKSQSKNNSPGLCPK